jgi:hypothetical protein
MKAQALPIDLVGTLNKWVAEGEPQPAPAAAPVPDQSPSGAPEQSPEPEAGPMPDGLPTRAIADLFEDVHFTNWSKSLSDAKWLDPARVQAGVRGGASAMWCPVQIAKLLHGKKYATTKQLTRVFANPALNQWRDEWDRFASVFDNSND